MLLFFVATLLLPSWTSISYFFSSRYFIYTLSYLIDLEMGQKSRTFLPKPYDTEWALNKLGLGSKPTLQTSKVAQQSLQKQNQTLHCTYI